MCCFNSAIDHVYATQIYVGRADGKQATVYGAHLVGSRIEMVLPVRSRGATELEFIDFASYPEFFTDCGRATAAPAWTAKQAAGHALPPAGALLEVMDIGDYRVSFAPSWRDLDRLDPAEFRLGSRLRDVLTEHYPEGVYGFVVYRPRHSGAMHPLGYRHPVSDTEPLFVPTRHEHGHDGPPDWDHIIYHQGSMSGVRATRREMGTEPAGRFFQSARRAGKPVPPEIDPDRVMKKLYRWGKTFPNGDLKVQPAPALSAAGGLSAAAAMTATTGLLRRRRALSMRVGMNGQENLPTKGKLND